ncbi:hypothetical protein GOC74_09925 [Halomicrobium mukohataei]|uniref:DUF2254 domain-containing protein n=1 Tax=Halomicrobium mukohataei TaxID=57705 RepID=A0A847UCP6_9EURY|nr:hypothetical protein [Halomicrobium mukohataei]NLV10246.1 hypothetical protein [Halomicrobium mukohataei]
MSGTIGILLGIPLILLENPPVDQYLQLLVGTQASIFAIVISVSIVSIQISSSEFGSLLAQFKESYNFIERYVMHFGTSIFISISSLIIVPSALPFSLPSVILDTGFFILAGSATAYAAYNFQLLQDLREEILDAINPEEILKQKQSTVTTSDFLEYRHLSKEDQDTSKHPLFEMYILCDQAIQDGNTHIQSVALRELKLATKKPIADGVDLSEITTTLDYWREFGNRFIEKKSETLLRIWMRSFTELFNTSFEQGHQDVEQLVEIQRGIMIKCINAGLGDAALFEKSVTPLEQVQIENSNPFLTAYFEILRHEIESHSIGYSDDGNPITIPKLTDQADVLLSALFDFFGGIIEADPKIHQDRFTMFLREVEEVIDSLSSPELHESQKDIYEKLISSAQYAADSGNQEYVHSITRLIIELYFVTRNSDTVGGQKHKLSIDKYKSGLLTVVESGGAEGVYSAFEEIQTYDEIAFDDIEDGSYVSLANAPEEVDTIFEFSNIGDVILNRDDALDVMDEMQEYLERKNGEFWLYSMSSDNRDAGLSWVPRYRGHV